MDVGGSYNEAAILIRLTPPPRRGEAVGAAEQTGLSSACFLPAVSDLNRCALEIFPAASS